MIGLDGELSLPRLDGEVIANELSAEGFAIGLGVMSKVEIGLAAMMKTGRELTVSLIGDITDFRKRVMKRRLQNSYSHGENLQAPLYNQ